jgi:flavin-binding protein dodecin
MEDGKAFTRLGVLTGTVEPMVQKITEVVGVSKKSFAEAAQNAVAVASKSVRNIKWFRVTEMEGSVHDGKVSEYHVTVKLYFDYEE